MTVSFEGDPFFPPDWQEQARAFLSPFEDEDYPTAAIYKLFVVRRMEYPGECYDLRETFRLGDIFIESEETRQYGMEERTVAIYARKTSFQSPLHFWVCAMLIYRPERGYDGATVESEWGFSVPYSHCHTMDADEFKRTVEHQWPQEWLEFGGVRKSCPLPSVMEEPVLRAWFCRNEWNKQFTWAETSDSFVLWCWETLA